MTAMNGLKAVAAGGLAGLGLAVIHLLAHGVPMQTVVCAVGLAGASLALALWLVRLWKCGADAAAASSSVSRASDGTTRSASDSQPSN